MSQYMNRFSLIVESYHQSNQNINYFAEPSPLTKKNRIFSLPRPPIYDKMFWYDYAMMCEVVDTLG
ncbi:MAG: hypothetical protein ACRC6X_02195 [Culicoidibacterales bacterium]